MAQIPRRILEEEIICGAEPAISKHLKQGAQIPRQGISTILRESRIVPTNLSGSTRATWNQYVSHCQTNKKCCYGIYGIRSMTRVPHLVKKDVLELKAIVKNAIGSLTFLAIHDIFSDLQQNEFDFCPFQKLFRPKIDSNTANLVQGHREATMKLEDIFTAGKCKILTHNNSLLAQVPTEKIIFFISHPEKYPVHQISQKAKIPSEPTTNTLSNKFFKNNGTLLIIIL